MTIVITLIIIIIIFFLLLLLLLLLLLFLLLLLLVFSSLSSVPVNHKQFSISFFVFILLCLVIPLAGSGILFVKGGLSPFLPSDLFPSSS